MKCTAQDKEFAIAFGRELTEHYARLTNGENGTDRMSDEEFAATLGVTRPALKKYLRGAATPSVGVVVSAYLRYRINVGYSGVPLFGRKRSAAPRDNPRTQLVFPFSVRGSSLDTVETRIEPKGENQFELRVEVRKAG